MPPLKVHDVLGLHRSQSEPNMNDKGRTIGDGSLDRASNTSNPDTPGFPSVSQRGDLSGSRASKDQAAQTGNTDKEIQCLLLEEPSQKDSTSCEMAT